MTRPPAPAILAGLAGLLACATLVVGCGTPPELLNPPPATVPSPRSTAPATPSPAPSPPPLVAPTPAALATPAFGELTAVDCQRRPSPDQVITLLRRTAGLLPPNASATVRTGPLCAGDWQYTEVQVPGREPLQVVTRGTPGALTLVTAGTNVCNIPVRTAAPPGIRARACDAAAAPLPGT